MAVLSYDLTDEERRRLAEQTGGVPSSEAGSSTPAPGTEASSDVPAPPTELKSPQAAGRSPWVDVGSYLDANKEQAQTLAGRVAGDLSAQGAGLRSDIDTAKSKFLGDVTKGSTVYDEALMNRAIADPTKLTDEERAKVKAMRDASYGGPESFVGSDDYTGLTGRVSEAANRAKGVDTEAGREAILTNVGTNPTKGQTAFNQLLIGANPEARAKLSAAAKPFEELNSYLDTAGTTAGEAAAKARADTEAARTRTNEAITGAENAFQTSVNQRLAAARQDALDRANQAKTGFTSYVDPTPRPRPAPEIDPVTGEPLPVIEPPLPGLSDQQLADLGISLDDANSIKQMMEWFNQDYKGTVNWDSQFTQRSPEVDIRAGNLASAEDYARLAALEDLMGTPTGLLNPEEAAQAGTANLDVLDFQGADAKNNLKTLLDSLDWQAFNDYAGTDSNVRQRVAKRHPEWGALPEAPPGPTITDVLKDTTDAMSPVPGLSPFDTARGVAVTVEDAQKSLDSTFAKPGRQVRDTLNEAGQDTKQAIRDTVGGDVYNVGSGAIDNAKDLATAPTKIAGDALKDIISNPGDVLKRIEQDLKNPVKTVTDNVNKAVNSVKKKIKKLCFAGHTPVTMADGSTKPIREIGLGDETKGGPVISIRKSLTENGTVYNYGGVIVTGSHAVNEDGRWVRVENSKRGQKVPGGLIVYSLVTDKHRIFVNGIEFADEHESDNYEELSIDQSLDLLNGELVLEELPATTQNGVAVGV